MMSKYSLQNFALAITTLSLGVLTTGCGTAAKSASDPKIYGGTKTAAGEWITTVALTNSFGGVYCTGTAISPRVIITAAHCVPSYFKAETIDVYLGEGKSGGAFRGQFKVSRIQAHPGYGASANAMNDIGYVLLAEPLPLPLTAYVPVLTAPNEISEVIRRGAPARVIGFGNRESGAIGEKYQVDTTISSVGASEVFIGGQGKDSCQGDSGGPAYTQLANGEWRVFGVVSRGGSCGQGGIYGLMYKNICWVQESAGVDLGLPSGTCVEAALPAPAR